MECPVGDITMNDQALIAIARVLLYIFAASCVFAFVVVLVTLIRRRAAQRRGNEVPTAADDLLD